jgi:hypothetical protein
MNIHTEMERFFHFGLIQNRVREQVMKMPAKKSHRIMVYRKTVNAYCPVVKCHVSSWKGISNPS